MHTKIAQIKQYKLINGCLTSCMWYKNGPFSIWLYLLLRWHMHAMNTWKLNISVNVKFVTSLTLFHLVQARKHRDKKNQRACLIWFSCICKCLFKVYTIYSIYNVKIYCKTNGKITIQSESFWGYKMTAAMATYYLLV